MKIFSNLNLSLFILLGTISFINSLRKGKLNLTNEISNIYFDIEEFRNALNEDNPTNENFMKIVKDLSSTLILILSEMESWKSFENAFISQIQNVTKNITVLEKNMNETKCSLSTRIIDIENEITKVKQSSESSGSKVTSAFGTETISPRDFLITPSMPYRAARTYCRKQGGAPFVPKTSADLRYLVERVTLEEEYGWLPLTDILEEGTGEWSDGTYYEEGPLRLTFIDTDSLNGNVDDKARVDIDKKSTADWYNCLRSRKMLCLINKRT